MRTDHDGVDHLGSVSPLKQSNSQRGMRFFPAFVGQALVVVVVCLALVNQTRAEDCVARYQEHDVRHAAVV